MSNVKERILGAVTVMSESDAEKVWDLIRATFALSNAETVPPTAAELAALREYHSGNADYQPTLSQDDVIKGLGL